MRFKILTFSMLLCCACFITLFQIHTSSAQPPQYCTDVVAASVDDQTCGFLDEEIITPYDPAEEALEGIVLGVRDPDENDDLKLQLGIDTTLINTRTWGNDPDDPITWTFDGPGANPAFTFENNGIGLTGEFNEMRIGKDVDVDNNVLLNVKKSFDTAASYFGQKIELVNSPSIDTTNLTCFESKASTDFDANTFVGYNSLFGLDTSLNNVTVGSICGFKFETPVITGANSGAATNVCGLFLESAKANENTTNAFGIYQAGEDDKNAFRGHTGMGMWDGVDNAVLQIAQIYDTDDSNYGMEFQSSRKDQLAIQIIQAV